MPAGPASTRSEAATIAPAMKRRFKLLAVLVGVPAVLVAAAAIVLPMLADSAHYKREVIALVKEQTGHELHIDGKVRLRILPRLRLTVTDIRLANPPRFSASNLVRLPWVAVDVQLLPLLGGRIAPSAIAVTGLRVNLERDQQGRGNWESATTVEQNSTGDQGGVSGAALAALAVGALTIRDATLHWRDHASGESFTVPAIDLHTGALRGGAGVDDVRLRVRLPGSDTSIETRGDATLSATGDTLVVPKLTTTFRDVGFAGMQFDGTLDTRLVVDFAQRRLNLDALRVSARGAGSEEQQVSVEITGELGFDLARLRLTESTLSAKIPAYSSSGINGNLDLKGILSGDLRAGAYAFEHMQGRGTLGGEAMADASVAFALGGALGADVERWSFSATALEIAGSVDDDGLPFRLMTDMDLSLRTQTLAATGMHLSIRDWRVDGAMTLRAGTSPPGVQGVLDVRVQDQPLAGSFGVSASEANTDGIHVRFDVVADLDIEDGGYALRGRNAVVLRAEVNPGSSDGSWHIDDLKVGARLTDTSFPDGELTIKLQADLEVDINDEILRSDNLRVTVDDSRIEGSVNVQRFDKPAVRVDLQADSIDADRYLLPVAGSAAGAARATPIGASIDAIRALDFTGEVRVQNLLLRGMQLKNVRLTAGGGVSGG